MAEDGRSVALNVLVPSDTVANLGQHRPEGGFADIEWITSEVVAVQFDQVEGVQERAVIMAASLSVLVGRHGAMNPAAAGKTWSPAIRRVPLAPRSSPVRWRLFRPWSPH
jgi:hypothetical protein